MATNSRGRLTAFKVQRLITEGKPGHYGDAGGLSLYLKISGKGTASWSMRFKRGGVLREMGLGSARILSLADARELAIHARKVLLSGRDPIEERKSARIAEEIEAARRVSFKDVAEAYMASRADWSFKHAQNWSSAMQRIVYPVFGHLPVGAIDTVLVIRALEPHWNDKRELISRLAAQLAQVFDYAKSRGLREGDNPASRSVLKFSIPRRTAPVRNFEALPAEEIPDLMRELGERSDVPARALRFTILTAARTGEALGATWDEIDMAEALWVIPAGRMKMGKEHRVPLSTAALAVLEEATQRRESARIFPGQRWSPDPLGAKLNDGAMLLVLSSLRPGVTVHGFRSAFVTWAAEADWPYEVRETCLAHKVGSDLERRYNRAGFLAHRRRLMEAWGAQCTGNEPAQVIPIPRR